MRARLAPAGLNAFGVVSQARFDAAAPAEVRTDRIHPATRSIVVVGSGGGAHFTAFLDYLTADPIARLARRLHPLDTFAAEAFAALGPLLDGVRVLHPTFSATVPLDFMKLAELAGLGRPSELGILVGPRFGPWFGLRAALFVPRALPETFPVARACDGCPAPCRAPGDPLAKREACVIAPGSRYDELERIYHYDRAAGRRLLCARFGVRDEVA